MSVRQIRDFIESRDIPPKKKAKALAEFGDIVERGLANFHGWAATLGCAFFWDKTKSGHNFWKNIDQAKKIKENKMKITPAAPRDEKAVEFDSLSAGDCFLWEGELLIKTNDDEGQSATRFRDGSEYVDMCGEYVIPVNVKMEWSFS